MTQPLRGRVVGNEQHVVARAVRGTGRRVLGQPETDQPACPQLPRDKTMGDRAFARRGTELEVRYPDGPERETVHGSRLPAQPSQYGMARCPDDLVPEGQIEQFEERSAGPLRFPQGAG